MVFITLWMCFLPTCQEDDSVRVEWRGSLESCEVLGARAAEKYTQQFAPQARVTHWRCDETVGT
jgi:hypothetical protein